MWLISASTKVKRRLDRFSSKIKKANDGLHRIGLINLHYKVVSGATIMSALLITGFKVRLEHVLTPQARDINLVLGPVVARSPGSL